MSKFYLVVRTPSARTKFPYDVRLTETYNLNIKSIMINYFNPKGGVN